MYRRNTRPAAFVSWALLALTACIVTAFVVLGATSQRAVADKRLPPNAAEPATAPGVRSTPEPDGAQAYHMTLLGHAPMLSGGEGFAMKMAGDRRILYVAHESGPACFTIFDVTNPAQPRPLSTVTLRSSDVRCNSLDVAGNVLVVAAETKEQGQPGGGFRLYALDDPAAPRYVSFFDASGPHSRGAHHVWLSSDKLVHMTSGAADFTPNRKQDDQFYRIVDISDPLHAKEVGRWWYPGQRAGDAQPGPAAPAMTNAPDGVRPHNIDVFPSHANRAYLGYIDGGLVTLDISDPAHPRTISIARDTGAFTHTVFPIFGRTIAFVSEEAVQDNCGDQPKGMTVWDFSDETKPRMLAAVPDARNATALCKSGGRYGPHNIYEDKPYGPTFKSDRYVVTSWFAGGVRIFDLADPQHPVEAAHYVPAAPADSPKHAIQINDVFVDDRGIVYACDRFTGGLYVLRSDVLKP
ncbi:MAG TPA: hypothetical protein VHT53_05335 [Candidatus Elarobacter sp.]|jgi:hypothetical protein|nr:hypothetical protein [Candidatus Elarobacter sp.]